MRVGHGARRVFFVRVVISFVNMIASVLYMEENRHLSPSMEGKGVWKASLLLYMFLSFFRLLDRS